MGDCADAEVCESDDLGDNFTAAFLLTFAAGGATSVGALVQLCLGNGDSKTANKYTSMGLAGTGVPAYMASLPRLLLAPHYLPQHLSTAPSNTHCLGS